MVDVRVGLHHLVQVECVDRAAGGGAHRVADEIHQVVVFEECGESAEDLAFLGFFDIGLDGRQAFAASPVKQLKKHLKRLEIALCGVLRAFEGAGDGARSESA